DGRGADKDAKGQKAGAEVQPFGFLNANDREKSVIRQLYTHLDPTMEWAENNYYHLPIQQQLADLVPVSQFWLDYARHDGKSPFLSRNVAEASRNFTEMMCALAV